MSSAEIQALLGEYHGPLYELADERPLGTQRLESTGAQPPRDGLPTRLDDVTIASGRPGDRHWLKVTTRMLSSDESRRQTPQFHLGFALLIAQVACGVAPADAQEHSDRRWTVARTVPATDSSVVLDDEPVASWRVEADLASVGTETKQQVVVFAESVDLPGIELIVWGDASVWPLPLRTVPDVQRYLTP